MLTGSRSAFGTVEAWRLDRARVGHWPAALILASLSSAVVLYGFGPTLSHDEHYSLAAATLWPERAFYRDFFYSQTPYFAVALSTWITLFDPISPYLLAKVFNVLWTCLFIAAASVVVERLMRSRVTSALLVAVATATPMLSFSLQNIRNDLMPLTTATAALGLLLAAVPPDGKLRWPLAFFSGLLMAASVGAKVSFAVVPLTAVVFLGLWAPARSLLPPLVLAGAVGGLPILYFASADWTAFLYDVFEFHRTTHAESARRYVGGVPLDATTYGSFRRLVKFNIASAALWLWVLLGFAAVGLAYHRRRLIPPSAAPRQTAAFLLSCLGIAISVPVMLLARPLHPLYMPPLLLFLLLATAAGLGLLIELLRHELGAVALGRIHLAAAAWLAAGFLVTAVWNPLNLPVYGFHYNLLHRNPADHFVTTAYVKERRAFLRSKLGSPDPALKVATLLSFYPIDAGFGIYPEFAGSPFFYRTNDILAPDRRNRLKGLAPDDVYAWLQENRPQAILTGYRDGFEDGFIDYARASGFTAYPLDLRGGDPANGKHARGVLWVAPDFQVRKIEPAIE